MLWWYLDIYHDIEICYDNSLSFYCVHGDPKEFYYGTDREKVGGGIVRKHFGGEKCCFTLSKYIY